MDDEVQHTSFAEQQAFLALPPEKQNLQIFMALKETNGHVAEVMRNQAWIMPMVDRHEFWFRVIGVAVGISVAVLPVAVLLAGK